MSKNNETKPLKQPAVMPWVALSDEQPPIHEWVLLGNKNDQWTDRGERYRDGTYHNGECEVIPTHWCPLPLPPCA